MISPLLMKHHCNAVLEPKRQMDVFRTMQRLTNIQTHLAYMVNVKNSCYMKQQNHSSESAHCHGVNRD